MAESNPEAWTPLAKASFCLPSHMRPIETEMLGMPSALRVVVTVLRQGAVGEGVAGHVLVDTYILRAVARPQLWTQAITARWRQPTTHAAGQHCKGRGRGRGAEDEEAEVTKHRRHSDSQFVSSMLLCTLPWYLGWRLLHTVRRAICELQAMVYDCTTTSSRRRLRE